MDAIPSRIIKENNNQVELIENTEKADFTWIDINKFLLIDYEGIQAIKEAILATIAYYSNRMWKTNFSLKFWERQ